MGSSPFNAYAAENAMEEQERKKKKGGEGKGMPHIRPSMLAPESLRFAKERKRRKFGFFNLLCRRWRFKGGGGGRKGVQGGRRGLSGFFHRSSCGKEGGEGLLSLNYFGGGKTGKEGGKRREGTSGNRLHGAGGSKKGGERTSVLLLLIQ